MVIDPGQESSLEGCEFEGVAGSIEGAVLDAAQVAIRQHPELICKSMEVTTWGVRSIGIGGSRVFWARIREKL